MKKDYCDDEQCPIFIHSQNLSTVDYDMIDNITSKNIDILNNNIVMLKSALDVSLKNLPYLNNIYVNYDDFISNNFSLRSDNKCIKKNYVKILNELFPLECMYCSKLKKFDVSEKIRSEEAMKVLLEK